ncbi:MAG: hypothetical protein ACFFDP_11310 [Promethearchaeota archaeon]
MTVYDTKEIHRISWTVNHIEQHGGVLIVITAHFKTLVKDRLGEVLNYSFLPWPNDLLKQIRTADIVRLRPDSTAQKWVEEFCNRFRNDLMSPAYFPVLPSGSHALINGNFGEGWKTVGLVYSHKRGRIILFPPIKSLIMGTNEPFEVKLIARFLESLIKEILFRFSVRISELPPWLDAIMIRNEAELIGRYNELRQKIEEISEEKTILAEYGKALTKKVAALFEWLGFHTEIRENEGIQDIEISEGKFIALVECSGQTGYFNIDKVRQLIDYIAEEGGKGIFVGNPWRNKPPRERDLPKAFTDKVIERANVLDICLITVPHLFRVCLDVTRKTDKRKVRSSIKSCKGLWSFPSSEW